MNLIEFKNLNVPLLEWSNFDAAWAVREKLFDVLWPLNHGQCREVMEEFSPLIANSLTWTVGTLIQVDRVMDNAVDIRSFAPDPSSYVGSTFAAWKYDVLLKTRPITSSKIATSFS